MPDVRAVAACAAAVVAVAALPVRAAGGAAVGRPAPAFRLVDPAGTAFTQRRFAGRPLYINVFASWCPPCRGEIPLIIASRGRHADVTYLGVDAQEPAGVARRFAAAEHITYAVGIDRGQMAITYGARSLPESVFIDRTGTIRAIVHGVVDQPTLEADLALISPARK